MALITQYWGLDGLILLFTGFICTYLYLTRNFKYWSQRGIKQVSPTALFGNLAPCIFAQKPVSYVFEDMYKFGKNEQFVGFYVIDQPHLLVRDPELIKHVLIKDFNNFVDRNIVSNKSDVVGRMNLFVVGNPDWRYIRQKLSPIFTSGRLKKMFELMLVIDKDFDIFLEALKLDGKGRPVDIKDVCAKFTTDMIGLTAYGMRFNSLTDPNAIIRRVGKKIFSNGYARHLELLSAFIIPQFVKLFNFHIFGKGASEFLREVFYEAIDARVKSGDKRADLIDLLVDLKKEQEKDPDVKCKLEGDALVAQAAVFFTGGFETSSSTMTFTLYELAKHPEYQEKLRQEIKETLLNNKGEVSYDMIMSSLPYLDMVVSEALRMYPILSYLDRKAAEDYQFPGTKVTIKRGTPVIIPLYGIHMDPDYFPNPHVFDPERFAPENKKNIKPNTYFPFGDGPRICIGMRLGLLQTKLGLIHLLSKYEFSPCEETLIPMEFDSYSAITSARKNLVLNMRKISA